MGRHLSQTQEGFEKYLSKQGFSCKRVVHFRGSWINGANRRLLRSLESIGHLERAGTIEELRDEGMSFPDGTAYNGRVRSAVIYRVIDKELNERILEMMN